MNKYMAFKELRRELATAYEIELKAIGATDAASDLQVRIGELELDFSNLDTQLAGSEARKILHEEMRGTLKTLLERYDRNLRGEAVGLGLELRGIAAATSVRDGLADAPVLPAAKPVVREEADKFSSELGAGSRVAAPSRVIEEPIEPEREDEEVVSSMPVSNIPVPNEMSGDLGRSDDIPVAPAPSDSISDADEAVALDPFESLIKNIEEEYASKSRDSGNAA